MHSREMSAMTDSWEMLAMTESWEIVALFPATVLDTLHPLKMTLLPGYWGANHDRPRTRNARPSNAQSTNIFVSKSPTFSLRTSVLLLASVIVGPSRKYTMRQFCQKTLVAPLCEWISRRAKRLNWHQLARQWAAFGHVRSGLLQ